MAAAVLFMIQHLNQGGTEEHFGDLVRGVDRARIEPHVIHFNDRDGAVARALATCPGLKKTFIPVGKAYDASGLRAIWQVRRYLRRERIAAVVTFHFVADFIGTLAAWGRSGAAVISSRRDVGFTRTARQLRVGRWLGRGVDRYIAVSEAVRAAIERDERIAPGRTSVIYNGIDFAELDAQRWDVAAERSRLGIAPDEVLIGCVANFNPVKGHLTLIEAFARLRPLCPDVPLRLLLAGDGPLRAAIEAKISALGLAGAVILVGNSRQVTREFQISDVVVLASETEGFSNSLVQAMALGKPVVACRVGGNPEAVADEQTGLLVAPKNPAALAGALARLARDPALRRRLGEAGRARARECFTRRQMLERTQELILRVIAER